MSWQIIHSIEQRGAFGLLRVQQPAAGVLQTPLGRGALTTQGVRDVHDDNAFHCIFETQRTCTATTYTHNDDLQLDRF